MGHEHHLGVFDPSIHPDLLPVPNSSLFTLRHKTSSFAPVRGHDCTINPNVGHMINSLTSTDKLHGRFSGEDGLSQQFSSSILQCFRLPSLRFWTWQTVLTWKTRTQSRQAETGREEMWVISFPCVRVTSYYPQDSARPLPSHDRFPATTFSRSRDLPTRTRGKDA